MKWVKVSLNADPKLMEIVRVITYGTGGRTSGRLLNKLTYLVNLHFVDKFGEPVADVKFFNQKWGPWSPDLALVYDEICSGSDDLQVVVQETRRGNARTVKPSKKTTFTSLDKRRLDATRDILNTFRFVKADRIVDFTKRSEFYSRTKYQDQVDFADYLKQREQAVADLRSAQPGEKFVLNSLGYKWTVRIETDGYSAVNAEFPGAITQGDSLEELEKNMREALVQYLNCEARLHEAPR